ncbi:MAG: hypothetical protein ACI9OD_002910 [Limisphaerales bacterium]|jgi:hypothetical protein
MQTCSHGPLSNHDLPVSGKVRLIRGHMKIFVLLATVLTFALLGVVSTSAADAKGKGKKKKAVRLRHMVCFKYKEGTSAKQIAEISKAFRALKSKIPGIVAFEMGENNSPEGLNKGITHCYLVTFDSEKSREGYLPHPAHKAFVALLKPHLDDVFVVDYFAK